MISADSIYQAYKPYFSKGKILSSCLFSAPEFEEAVIKDTIQKAISILSTKSALVHASGPLIVVGDIHGNITDLLRIFQHFGPPPLTKYLFLGDYVDRGKYSVPVITLLTALYCKFPESITLLRGNHEFSHINRTYGFYSEVITLFCSDSIWKSFQELFAYLPLAAIVNNRVFCVHGGLSPELDTPNTIAQMALPIYSYDNNSLISDLVWSDPGNNFFKYAENRRGSGVIFGIDAVASFLNRSRLKLIIRGHQCIADGTEIFANGMGVTVFSAGNYCRMFQNRCGIVKLGMSNRVELISLCETPVLRAAMMMGCKFTGLRKVLKKKTTVVKKKENVPQLHTTTKSPIRPPPAPKSPVSAPRSPLPKTTISIRSHV